MYRDIENDSNEKRFRKAYVTKAGRYDFSALREHCDRIVYVTDGLIDEVPNHIEQLEEAFADFDPNKDVLIPVGNASISVLMGALAQRKIAESGRKNWDSYVVAFFIEGIYQFWRIYADPKLSYEVIRI